MEDHSYYKCEIYGVIYYIRPSMREALERYIREGLDPGNFLHHILIHDFYNALSLADDDNFRNIQAYAHYLYNEMPGQCHGSKEKVEAWIEKGGSSK